MCVINKSLKQSVNSELDKNIDSLSTMKSNLLYGGSDENFTIPPAHVVAVFLDGGVGVYDIKRNCWDFLRELVIICLYYFRLFLLMVCLFYSGVYY